MRRHTLTMSLALFSAGFVWGCQDRESTPLGPDGLSFGAAQSDKDAVVELSVGMSTPEGSPQAVRVSRDSKNILKLDASSAEGQESFLAAISLTLTQGHAEDNPTECVTQNNGLELTAKLVDPEERGRNFVMEFDKLRPTSDRHRLGMNWADPLDGRRIRLQIRSGSEFGLEGFGDLMVTEKPVDVSTTEYSFSRGAVRVWRLVGPGLKTDDQLVCPNLDTVVVTVTR